ncbi:hypothetical protein HanXRQr2_Chr17g0789861 [Helianthus annuus]|uniref:Uncharacterized protein n=1 Tax=Helianthus annuus TaxID=4232 RepID=A0A251RMI7_HELAN|nr:hypothetical protein HanXRQr2_Chr17g0789861 [Helianthus annuus]KAJ0432286.1 hypothetical protein HanIR_Chr17g0857531 [Helianthus annuus]KAJ0812092.1 hypothetical protein HanPSC8_Chr17g0757971 [Helianthus annuus]
MFCFRFVLSFGMLVCHRFRLKHFIGRLLLVYTILRGLGSDDYTMIKVRQYLMFNRSSVISDLHLADTDFISSPLKTSLSRLIPPFVSPVHKSDLTSCPFDSWLSSPQIFFANRR